MLNLELRNIKSCTASTLATLLPQTPATADLRGISLKLSATLSLLAVFAFFSTTASAQVRIEEGASGALTASLPNPVQGTVYTPTPEGQHRIFYKYKTVNGEAEAGDDYKAVPEGEFLFSAGQQHKTVTVETYSDDVDQECKEDFYLKLYDKKHQRLEAFTSGDPESHYTAWVDIQRASPPKEFKVKAIILDRTQSGYNTTYGSCNTSGTYGE